MKRYERNQYERQGEEATGEIFKKISDKSLFRKTPGYEPWEEKQLLWCIGADIIL